VEDEALIRLALAEFLQENGYSVIEASTGQEALALLQAGSCSADLIFSDVTMPGEIDGFELAKWVSEHRPDIPVLLGSGHVGETKIPKHFSDEGRFLAKPYDLDLVLASIQAAFRQGPGSRAPENGS
jgi:CheY-like chemotaxis protein